MNILLEKEYAKNTLLLELKNMEYSYFYRYFKKYYFVNFC